MEWLSKTSLKWSGLKTSCASKKQISTNLLYSSVLLGSLFSSSLFAQDALIKPKEKVNLPAWQSDSLQVLELNELPQQDIRVTSNSKLPNFSLLTTPTYSLYNSAMVTAATSEPELVELVKGLKNDPGLIYNFVRDTIDIDYTYGLKKGPLGTLLDGSGNFTDQAELLVTLLELAGFDASYVKVTVTHSAEELANWMKVDIPNGAPADFSKYAGLLQRMGVTGFSGSYSAVNINHMVVKVVVNGSIYYLDPSYKQHNRQTSTLNIASALGFNKSSFLSSSKSGSTVNSLGLRSSLQQYATNLENHLNQHYADKSVDDAMGSWSLVDTHNSALIDASSYIQSYSTEWKTLPDSYKTTLRITHRGIDETFDTRDIYTKRLSIYYPTGGNSPSPQLYLDGQLVATGSATSRNTSNSISFNANHPNSNGYADQNWTQYLTAGGAYTISSAWGRVGENHLDYQTKKMVALGSQSSQSEPILNQSLMLLGMKWARNIGEASKFSGKISGTNKFRMHLVGIAGTGDVAGINGGPYVDFGGGFSGDNVGSIETFVSDGLLSSAFEHGVIEQNQPFTAVSTVKLLNLASQNNLPLYEANQSNWSSVKSQLVSYSAGNLSSLDNYISQGYRLLLPENGSLQVNDWQGLGYLSLFNNGSQYSAGYIIGGGYKGGFSTETGEVTSEEIVETTENIIAIDEEITSADSVNYVNGSGVYNYQDLKSGSGAGELTFSRSYNASSLRKGNMAKGWQHNFDLTLNSSTNIERAINNGTALDATASIVAQYVVNQMMEEVNSSLIDSVGISSGVYQWLMDEYTDNVRTVSLPSKTVQFVELPSGNFSAPKKTQLSLIKHVDDSHTVTSKKGGVLDFNSFGNIQQITDKNNNTINFAYSGDLLSTVSNSFGRQFSLFYDGMNRVTTVQDDSGRSIEYNYGSDVLTTFKNANNETYTYGYDYKGRLDKLFSPLYPTSPEFVKTYNDLDQVVSQTSSIGGVYTYYFANGYRTEKVDALGNGQTMWFDKNGNMIKQRNALNEEVLMAYDSVNRLTATQYPNGAQQLIQYDDSDNPTLVTKIAEPGSLLANVISSFGYNASGDVIYQVNGNGARTDFDYDVQGNLIQTQLPSVNGVRLTTTKSYQNNGLVSSSLSADGVTTNYTYDVKGNVTNIVQDPSGLAISTALTYWPTGDIKTQQDALGQITTFNQYDGKRRLLKQTSPEGRISEWVYNLNGLATQVKRQSDNLILHPSGYATQFLTYYRDEQVATQTDEAGNIVTFNYDLMGNKTLTIDAEQRQSKVVYDSLNRPIKKQKKLNGSFITLAEYTYSDTGKVLTQKGANSNVTTYDYDGFDRVSTTTYPDYSTESYTYTVDDQPSTFTSRDGVVTSYQYDDLSRVTEKEVGASERNVYTFNNKGQQTLISQYTPASSTSAKTLTYAFDTVGRNNAVTDSFGRQVSYGFNKLNQRTSLTYPDSTVVNYQYNDDGQMTKVLLGNSLLADYQFNALSQLTNISYGNGVDSTVSYESDGDMSTLSHQFVTSSMGYQYSYNNAGQLTAKLFTGQASPWMPLTTTTEQYTTNNLNQSTSIGSNNLAFDNNGNLTSTSDFNYDHNELNQLIGVDAIGNNNSIIYAYDALNRRSEKTVFGSKTSYLYDGNEAIAEFNSSNALTAKFIYGSGIDNPIAMIKSGQTYYYHTNEIGSVVALSNAQGNVQEQYSYGPFGESNDISLIGNPLRYTARRLDDETGNYYYRARYYQPQWGKFIQADPLGYKDGMNMYAYVGHDPINFIDPLGTMAAAGGFASSTGAVDTGSSMSDYSSSSPSFIDALQTSFEDNVTLQYGAQGAFGSGVKIGNEHSLDGFQGSTVASTQGYGFDISARISGSPINSGNELSGGYTAFTVSGGAPISISFSFSVDENKNWAFSSAVGSGASLFIGTEIGYIFRKHKKKDK